MSGFPQQGNSRDTWGTELRNFFSPFFDLATGAFNRIFNNIYSISYYGNDLTAAVAAIGSIPRTLVIDTNCVVTAVTTVPTTLSIKCGYPGTVTKTSGTLTLNGPFEAGLYQVFTGFSAGDVTFGVGSVSKVDPIWFGYSSSFSTSKLGNNEYKNYLTYDQIKVLSLFDGYAGTEWSRVSGGTLANDTTNYVLSSKGIKWSAGDGGTIGEKALSVDYSTYDAIRLVFYVNDASKLSFIKWIFSTDTGYTNYYSVLIGASATWPFRTGWNTYTLFKSQLTSTGTPNWNSIVRARIQVAATAGNSVEVSHNEITFFKNTLTKPIIVITFDDGSDTQYTNARPALDKHRFPATAFVVPTWIGTANTMTKAQIQNLQNVNGWDIASHGFAHEAMDSLTSAQLEEIYQKDVAWFEGNGIRFVPALAYPSGYFNLTTMPSVLKKYYVFGRSVSTNQMVMPFPLDDKFVLRTAYIGSSISLATAEGYIDDAIAKNGILFMTFHKIVTSSPGADDWLTSDFTSLVDYIATKDVYVYNFSQLMKL